MLQPDLVKQILEAISQGEYVGIHIKKLHKHFVNEDAQTADKNDYLKFVYHMDEIYDAGLIKNREVVAQHRWGKSEAVCNAYLNVYLLLTPVGAAVLKELNKPKGLDRFIQAIKSAGAVTGQEALKYGIGELFKAGS